MKFFLNIAQNCVEVGYFYIKNPSRNAIVKNHTSNCIFGKVEGGGGDGGEGVERM